MKPVEIITGAKTVEGVHMQGSVKVQISPKDHKVFTRLNELKKQANENLCSEKGLELRSQRVVEVEQTFGRIKGCWSFRRFLLRGKEKVKIEWGLLSIAHNITKMALEG